MQCVKLPGSSCPTGTALSFQNTVATLRLIIRRLMTQWRVLLDRLLASRYRSRRLLTTTAGRTSYLCQKTTQPYLGLPAGTERSLSTTSSVTTRTTRSRGSYLVLSQQTNNWTTFYNKYDQAQEVYFTHYFHLGLQLATRHPKRDVHFVRLLYAYYAIRYLNGWTWEPGNSSYLVLPPLRIRLPEVMAYRSMPVQVTCWLGQYYGGCSSKNRVSAG